MKHHILLSVKKPDTDTHQGQSLWIQWELAIKTIERRTIQGDKLSESVWLFERENDISAFSLIVAAAIGHDLPYQALFFSIPEEV